MQELGVVFLQLFYQDPEFFPVVLAVGGNEKEQNRVSFYMAEESMTQSLSFRGTFDDTGQVGHTEAAAIPVFHHAELGGQCGESIVGDLGFGGRNYGQQGGFAGIGEAYETYI